MTQYNIITGTPTQYNVAVTPTEAVSQVVSYVAGPSGLVGASAYEIAVAAGFVGTEPAWLASLVGAQGPAGLTGATGPQGTQGTVGLTGPAGNSMLYGIVAPTTEGANGDSYINTATSYLYGPKASGTWPAGVSLVGAAGVTGSQGTPGVTGEQGIQGDMGLQGIQGTPGPQGIQGIQGDVGVTGIQGIQGVPGSGGGSVSPYATQFSAYQFGGL